VKRMQSSSSSACLLRVESSIVFMIYCFAARPNISLRGYIDARCRAIDLKSLILLDYI